MHARRAALDLRYLGGDGGLARVVELEIKLGDERFRVVGSGGHGRHAGGVFAGAGLAIVKGCPDEELAKLLYDFIMNPEEGQVILANNNVTPVQPATPIPEGMYSASWIAENALYVDVAKMAAESAELLAKYDALFKS